MLGGKTNEFGRNLLLYGLSFLLLLEWIIPLPQISDTGYIPIFILITFLFFVVTFLQLPLMISILLKILIIISSIHFIFFDISFFSMEWISAFVQELQRNVQVMLAGNWYALTDTFRSLLFFILLAIMSYLLFYWTVHARRVSFFIIFTVIYIAVLDTYTEYDATIAIIRIFIIGFVLLGLVTVYRKWEQGRFENNRFATFRITGMIVVLVVSTSLVASLLPKHEPQWEDPVPFFRNILGLGPAESSVQRIGYGSNDTQLGGGFVYDYTPLFHGYSSQAHYWRGETKDFYTGKGWEVTTPSSEVDRPIHHYFPAQSEEDYMAQFEPLTTEVEFLEGSSSLYPHLFYPGELETRGEIDQNATVSVDFYTGKARTVNTEGEPLSLDSYTFDYAYPTFYIDDLRESQLNDDGEIYDYYTQLPENLPERIGELAEELVEGIDNRYDQAKAIEFFLSGPEFEYETEDVPVPDADEDYVDQFLFETQRGYCDNFSTSMVVMLRTLDIPARWVKGFTNGTMIDSANEEVDIYEITNANAHSWVEVYFPEVGWVPFEPTKGFNTIGQFTFSPIDMTEEDPEVEDAPEVEEEEEETQTEEEETETEEQEENEESAVASSNSSFNHYYWILPLLVLMILIVSFRKKLVKWMMKWRFMSKQNEETFMDAYEALIRYLVYCGYERLEGETLREYAIRIDEIDHSNDMMLLTTHYERLYYGKKEIGKSWSEHKQLWLKVLEKNTA
ncbi:DUF4129 domain-containing transglutaminase family protein [Alkalihalobacillus trypoxylicola]|uniref:Transglutaminase-like domain-containing protein n=1 Tax=Alkalihalobacillus trypoxylicola TaxID=519424 RepID=A0A161Q0W6_9BACI|nr:DUF4129 domain-containing transglutaminase family protein [Alkalihalobacillus trypoxylicola]KYG29109.1 hypothetical protein AZF04_20235 [Alkalihalobacillus trypoxylicola]GAF66767.1 protease [Bacillus sp. TS-2]